VSVVCGGAAADVAGALACCPGQPAEVVLAWLADDHLEVIFWGLTLRAPH
jgi:hypothetical protein